MCGTPSRSPAPMRAPSRHASRLVKRGSSDGERRSPVCDADAAANLRSGSPRGVDAGRRISAPIHLLSEDDSCSEIDLAGSSSGSSLRQRGGLVDLEGGNDEQWRRAAPGRAKERGSGVRDGGDRKVPSSSRLRVLIALALCTILFGPFATILSYLWLGQVSHVPIFPVCHTPFVISHLAHPMYTSISHSSHATLLPICFRQHRGASSYKGAKADGHGQKPELRGGHSRVLHISLAGSKLKAPEVSC